jgi:hypothetical protein
MPLYIPQGPAPNWWLSPAIWVTPTAGPYTAPGVTPIAGDTFDVWVNVQNPWTAAVDDWNLYVCWAIPTAGPIPLPPSSQVLNNAPIGSFAASSAQNLQTATNWKPSFAGHECLVAVAYDQEGGMPGALMGNAVASEAYSIAQHNFGVLPVGSHMRGRRFQYAFQVCSGDDGGRRFVVAARQAPLSEIESFLPSVPGGRTVLDKPGKVERLGIVASAHPDPEELEAATAALSHVEIAPRSCRAFTLGGSLQHGNALIHVTQSLDERVVGGLSVLLMAEEK